LIDAVVSLGDDFIGVLHAAAEDAWHPCPHKSAAFSPAVKTLAIRRDILIVLILFWQSNVLRFPG
jgi:hypothetical protein